MNLSEIIDHCAYEHRKLGPVWVVGRHPHDGAAVIVYTWDNEEDELKFHLAVSEDFVKPMEGPDWKPTHCRALAHFNHLAGCAPLPKVEMIYPEHMTKDLEFALGRPNFQMAKYAHLFRDAGHDIARKAEAEQAFVIHELVKCVLMHGEKWDDAFQAKVNAAVAKVKERANGKA